MKVDLIVFAIPCIFFLLAIYHLAAARRMMHPSDAAWPMTVRVRKRVGTLFLLVGAGLLGYYWLGC
jgi:hypothetical protein